MERWDAIVAGCGIGGMAAAIHLGRAGKTVLVLDANPHPGGTAWSFVRKGFTFPMGPLGVSSPKLMREVCAKIGVDFDDGMEWKRVHYRLRALGLDLPLSLPFDEEARELGRAFPEEADNIERVFADLASIIADMADPEKNRERLEKWAKLSSAEYLSGLIRDNRLIRVLGSQGTEEPYAGMFIMAAMWDLLGNQGIWRPAGGMKALAEKLKGAFDALPVRHEMKLGARVERIIIKDGRAVGVVCGGEEIEAEAVISNADYKAAFLELVPAGRQPPDFRAAVESARVTSSVVQVSLGVEAARVDLSAFANASRILYRRGGAPLPAMGAGLEAEAIASRELEIALWSSEADGQAPPGQAALVIRVHAEYDDFSRWRAGFRKRAAGYVEYKERLARALIAEAEKVLPGLAKAVEVAEVSTPLTFRDQGGRSGGAVAGWSWNFEDDSDYRARDLALTPVAGLYMAGYQARSSLFAGGVPTALMSGLRAAELAIANAAPTGEVLIPARKRGR